LGNVLLCESWLPHFLRSDRRYLLVVIWSLCYEEQFYAITAAVMAVFRTRFQAVFSIVSVGVFILQCLAWKYQKITNGFFFDGYWMAFWPGVLLYQFRCRASCRQRGVIVFVLCLLGALPLLWSQPFRQTEHLPVSVTIAAAFALALVALSPWDEEISTHPVARALSWCGVRCYSIYLLHWPITKLISHLAWIGGLRTEALTLGITFPVCTAISLLLSGWFYRNVESRFLSRKPARPEAI
jgi:peptidoglycan/LPS O-acetylase OafA/YrhL